MFPATSKSGNVCKNFGLFPRSIGAQSISGLTTLGVTRPHTVVWETEEVYTQQVICTNILGVVIWFADSSS